MQAWVPQAESDVYNLQTSHTIFHGPRHLPSMYTSLLPHRSSGERTSTAQPVKIVKRADRGHLRRKAYLVNATWGNSLPHPIDQWCCTLHDLFIYFREVRECCRPEPFSRTQRSRLVQQRPTAAHLGPLVGARLLCFRHVYDL